MLLGAMQCRFFSSTCFSSIRAIVEQGQCGNMSNYFLNSWSLQSYPLKLSSQTCLGDPILEPHSASLQQAQLFSPQLRSKLSGTATLQHGIHNKMLSKMIASQIGQHETGAEEVEDTMLGFSDGAVSKDLWIRDKESEEEQAELSAELDLAELTAGTIRLGEYEVPLGKTPLVVGIDPDLSGALAVLRFNSKDACVEVMDVPLIKVKVGTRLRRRHDAISIAGMLRQLEAPLGSVAYLEQPTPFPKDGKQGWYSSGYSYGIWVGILATLGFTIIPVPACRWKRALGLVGCESPKDESRNLASTMFPSVASQLKRKKDHGRAEALLIAAWGHGVRSSCPVDRVQP